jgi:hypothetical protein
MTRQANRSLKHYALAAFSVALWMMSESSAAACLLKPRQEAVGTGFTLMVAPEREVGQYMTLGFSRVACPTDMSLVREYVRQLCDGTGPRRALDTDTQLGRTRELACASALAGLAESSG